MEWLVENGVEVLAILGALVGVATAIARLTPTNKDDAIIGQIKKLLDYVALGGINRGLKK